MERFAIAVRDIVDKSITSWTLDSFGSAICGLSYSTTVIKINDKSLFYVSTVPTKDALHNLKMSASSLSKDNLEMLPIARWGPTATSGI